MKKGFLYILILSAILSLMACNDNTDVAPIEPPEPPKYVRLYFDFEYMSANDVDHNYIYDGYTVAISKSDEETEEVLENVNLLDALEIENSGEVTISVVHPDYQNSEVMTSAYYKKESFQINTETASNFTMHMDLLQGYVTVNTDTDFNLSNHSLEINRDASDFNDLYYVSKIITSIEIESNGLLTTIVGENKIGEGLMYYVYESDNGELIIYQKIPLRAFHVISSIS